MESFKFVKALLEVMYELSPSDKVLESFNSYIESKNNQSELNELESETLREYFSTLIIWVHPKYKSEKTIDKLRNFTVNELFNILFEGIMNGLVESGNWAMNLSKAKDSTEVKSLFNKAFQELNVW